ncbi:MAG: hypothetical protein KGL35_07980, partial [Bradyrhizobium sp.]|nr:hypothetical protein [Bradyrhizobium sp.]
PQQYELFAGLLSKMTEEQRQRAEAAEAAAGVMRETIAWISRVAAPGSGVRGECERILATAPGRAANELRAGKALAGKIRDALCSVEAIAHVERALADYDQAVAQGEQRGEGQHGR